MVISVTLEIQKSGDIKLARINFLTTHNLRHHIDH